MNLFMRLNGIDSAFSHVYSEMCVNLNSISRIWLNCEYDMHFIRNLNSVGWWNGSEREIEGRDICVSRFTNFYHSVRVCMTSTWLANPKYICMLKRLENNINDGKSHISGHKPYHIALNPHHVGIIECEH